MVRLVGPFSKLGSGKALVIGDMILDSYTIGKVERISPEAPVPVLHVRSEECRPGGAGNVMLSLVALGMEVIAVGRVGKDSLGTRLKKMLSDNDVNIVGMLEEENYQTPVKNRIIADKQQQIIRIDYEEITPLPASYEEKIVSLLPELLEGVDVIAVSDYGKGFLTRSLLATLIRLARERGIPTIIDPKGSDFKKYEGVTVLKPNLLEALAAARLPASAPIDEVAVKLFEDTNAETLIITRSEAGIAVFQREGTRKDFPVKVKEVNDVTGAGDTVLSTISCALANGLDIYQAAQLSNVAAGIAIEHMGCVHVGLSEFAERLLEYDVVNKVFREEHLFAFEKLLDKKRCIVLGVDGEKEGFTSTLYKNIRQLASRDDDKLIIYIKDHDPDEEFVNMVASLNEVSYIILQNDNLKHFCKTISPEEVYILEEGVLQTLEHTEALLV